MEHLLLRQAEPQDAGCIAEMEKICFTTPWSYEAVLEELTQNDRAVYLVAEQDGRVIGYAGIWLILEEGHITNVAVLPEYRGRRVGMTIVRRLLEATEAQGITCHTLEVRQSNRGAIALYEKCGFEICGIRKGYYLDNGEDALIMWRHTEKTGRQA